MSQRCSRSLHNLSHYNGKFHLKKLRGLWKSLNVVSNTLSPTIYHIEYHAIIPKIILEVSKMGTRNT